MVRVCLPAVLAELAGSREVAVAVCPPATLADVLDALRGDHPAVERRIRDETGAVRRHVNVYVDGADVRGGGGQSVAVPPGAEVLVVPAVSGG